MAETFAEILKVGGKTNSLGRTGEVMDSVLRDPAKFEELYTCVFNEDAWVRMRAMDAIEKICREHPEWLAPYINRFQSDLGESEQPSIQWHLAQIYRQVELSDRQKTIAINWLKNLLSSKDVDWIVATNAMETLVKFLEDGSVAKNDVLTLIEVQQGHKSKSVVKKMNKFLEYINS